LIRRALIAVFLVALAACNREKPAAPAAAAAKPLKKVRFNVNPTLAYAPFMIAKAEGFFEQEGIDAEFVGIDQNSALVALTTGELDIVSGPIRSGIFNIMVRNAPVRIVSDKGQLIPKDCVMEAFAAQPDIADRIAAKGGSVKGEKFALIRGGFTEFMIDRYLAQQNLTRADVGFVQIPPAESMATRTRKIEAIRYVQEPILSNGLAQGIYKVIQPADKVAPGQQHGAMMYGKRLLYDDPELGKRFMRAFLRGARQYNQGKTRRNVEILAAATKMPVEIVQRACWIPVANDGRVDMKTMNALLDWSKEHGYLDGDVPVAKWWDPRFVDAANQSLGAQ
jgi:NitT/TauT family transport system substrate-binding protein